MRPIVKIGLIAPFEGLYRQSGYAALEAMRQAIQECTPPGMDVLPLALDDGGDPAQALRAAQKLLVDPTVRAIVGPLLLESVPAVSTVITPATGVAWYIPALVEPEGGFAAPATPEWLQAQVDFVANDAAAERVLLLGLPSEWQIAADGDVPTLRIDKLESARANIVPGDALLWLGRPDVGARWYSSLQENASEFTFWLADQAGREIFAAHSGDHMRARWLLWTDSKYNQWSQSDASAIEPTDFEPLDAVRYQSYRATCTALSAFSQEQSGADMAWQLHSISVEHP
jgi:branched-chain amino acid transport system substrate-binding protein